MLLITKYNPDQYYRPLEHNDEVFHNALKHTLYGEYNFHVVKDGEYIYDLEYIDNNELGRKYNPGYRHVFMPPFISYDESITEAICYEILPDNDVYYFDELSEYAVVLTKLILKYSDAQVIVNDENIYTFIEPHERLHVGEKPEANDRTLCLSYKYACRSRMVDRDINVSSLFLDVFIVQWLYDRGDVDLKNIVVSFGYEEGIGSIVRLFAAIKKAFAPFNINVYLDKKATRFPEGIWKTCLNYDDFPDDMNESNTLQIVNIFPLIACYQVLNNLNCIDYSIFRKSFIDQVEEYMNAVINPERTIGVLLRGTDYVTTGLAAGRLKQVGLEDVVASLENMLATGDYDKIFLATEDKDIMYKMFDAFPDKIVVIAQERNSVNDFKDVVVISDLERTLHSGEEYENALVDKTVNYLYAMYILSRCASFVTAGMTSAVGIIRPLNNGKFKECHILSFEQEQKN